MAIFGQMFLNRGAYGDVRVLSPASVAAMTPNQTPGISAHYGDQFFPEASWGFGWNVHGPKKSIGGAEALSSDGTFSHGGLGGTFLWMDPACDLVGAYFSVQPKVDLLPGRDALYSELLGRREDLFVNAVTAAVVE